MISYFTHVQLNNEFDKDVLISMFLEWLSTSKNKIEGFEYSYQPSFIYNEKRKQLRIEDFTEYKVFGIKFTTSDNYKKTQFIVEMMYDYSNQTLDLGFYKLFNQDSKIISAISLPKIFVQLLSSSYIESDNGLSIQNKPHFLSYKEYKELKSHRLPLVVLYRNEKCCVNPVKLADKLFGIGHVICIHTKKNPTMSIYYPNSHVDVENESESKMMAQCYSTLLNYSIQENSQSYMFDELIKARLNREHTSSKELENYYLNEFEVTKNEVNEYEQLLNLTQIQYNELLLKKEELIQKLKSYEKEALLSTNHDYQKKHDLLIEIIKKSLNSLASREVYRKRDVLSSILKENES